MINTPFYKKCYIGCMLNTFKEIIDCVCQERDIHPLPWLSPQVGDHQCLLQSLKDSPYFAGFADKAALWEGRLAELDHHLQHLNQIQRRWVYLEPIFGHGALPREQARFKRVDADFR